MSAHAFQLGDYVQKLHGVDAGKMGTVDAVVPGNNKSSLKLRVRHWKTPTESVMWKLQSATNYELIEACPPEMPLHLENSTDVALTENTPPSSPRALTSGDISHPVNAIQPANLVSDRVTRQSQHSLVAVSWNAHQFTFMDDCDKQPLLVSLARMMVMDWRMDVLLLSEIPKEKGLPRVKRFCKLLNNAVGDETKEFQVYASELSGVHRFNDTENRPEYHVALVRNSIEVETVHTHHRYIDSLGNGYKLDHAPFTVFLKDSRFRDEACRRVALTSVHLPPRSRRVSRDRQGAGFLRSYQHQWGWEDDLKFNRPATFTATDKPFCTHIVGGDFNCSPADTLGLSSDWWVAFDDSVGTSYGAQAYDNWLVNRSAVDKAWLDVTKNVGALPLTQHTSDGLSDHDAIILTLIEKVPCR